MKGLYVHKTHYCSDSAVEHNTQPKIVIVSYRKQKCEIVVIAYWCPPPPPIMVVDVFIISPDVEPQTRTNGPWSQLSG